MKRLIALLLVGLISVLPLSLTACTITDAVKELTAMDGPSEADRKRTLALDNIWTDVWVEGDWSEADLTVTNTVTSAYDVMVRIVSTDYSEVIASEKTIESGYSATFHPVPSGKFIIQAKSADDVTREYTLAYGG